MRVIGGHLKGRRFSAPKKFEGRPTTDFAREALFNVLQHQIELDGIHALDLFCGTGAICFELASRGAERVVGIEKLYHNVRHVRLLAEEMAVEQVEVHCADVFEFLTKRHHPVDLVFADPPYAVKGLNKLPDLILGSGHLKADGLLVLEHGQDHTFGSHPKCEQSRKYGGVHFSFFRP